ncbi:MAG: formimidoylglutamase [Nonlabens sp.]
MSFEFLNPVSKEQLDALQDLHHEQLGRHLLYYQDGDDLELKDIDIAIVGCRETRRGQNEDFKGTYVEAVKSSFYAMYPGHWNFKIIDLGVIESGAEVDDSYFALRQLSEECLKKETILIVIGGSQDLNFPLYRSFDSLQKMVNVVNIDSRFDIGNLDAPITAASYVSKMVSEKPYNLYSYANLGYQTFYNSQEEIDLLDSLFFDTVRLGDLDHDMKLAEPLLRDADLISVDLQGIEGSFLAFAKAYPNGITGKQICNLSRYAGISDKAKFFTIFELPLELSKQSIHLITQMMWYFIEGVSHRFDEYPVNVEKNFLKYMVAMDREELVFYKSSLSGRWWIELPFFTGYNNKLKQYTLLACDQQDYELATQNIMPERWLKARMKNEM